MMPLSASEVMEFKSALAGGQADAPGWTHGAYLKMADRATHMNYSAVGQVLRVSGLKLGAAQTDVTTHLSGGWRETQPGIKVGGRVIFLVHFERLDPTLSTSDGLAGAALEQSRESFQLCFADGSVFGFEAYVSLEFEQPARAGLLALVSLQISGQVTNL